MKWVRPFVLSLLTLLSSLRPASGADDYGHDINSPSDNDPTISSRNQDKEPTEEEKAAMKKLQDKAAADRDWMARGVQDYRNRTGTSSDSSPGTSFYERLRSNKDLAKLAGITVPDEDSGNDASKAYRTGANASGGPSMSLRPDSVEKKAPGSTPFGAFKPLVQPMGFINKALPPFVQPPPLPSSSNDTSIDLLDSPGMTAAARNPLFDQSDLKFDISTLDPMPDSKISGQGFGKGQLPISSTADRLPMAPTAKDKVQASATATTVNPAKVEIPPDLQPVKPIPISPIRAPIADTHDILFR